MFVCAHVWQVNNAIHLLHLCMCVLHYEILIMLTFTILNASDASVIVCVSLVVIKSLKG